MRFFIVFALTYLQLFVFKRMGVPSIRAGVLSGFIAAIAVNAVYIAVAETWQFAVIGALFSACTAPLFGFFVSNHVYGVKPQK